MLDKIMKLDQFIKRTKKVFGENYEPAELSELTKGLSEHKGQLKKF